MDGNLIRILVIDDDEGDLILVRAMLTRIKDVQFDLEEAATFAAGLQALGRQAHDICLLDFRLNGQSGLDLLRQAKSLGCQTPIIMLTGQGDHAVDIEAMKAGAADYLAKGHIDAELLERSIRYTLERSRAAEALHRSREELELRVAERTAELSRANALLADTDRRKDQFLAMLAHELRNPLAALTAAAEYQQLPDADQALRRQIDGVVQRQVRQLSHLVDDLLDVARIMRDKIDLRVEDVDLKSIVAQAVESVRPLLGVRRQLQVSLPAEPLPLRADTTRLVQVFANLLNNAVKFTCASGQIQVSAEIVPRDGSSSDADVVVSVRDDGIGMSPEIVPHVFDLFMQASSSLDRSHGGLGIGLTLVHRLVRLHGGSVWAHSDGPGQGSVFFVRLHLAAAAPEAKSPAVVEPRSEPCPKRRILLVDDNVDTAESLARLLRHMGQEVRTAHDGSIALQMAPSFRPEIILLDIGLPGLSGYEVAALLRQQEGMNSALLVALTGYNQRDPAYTRGFGFDHYLTKPVGLRTLQKLLVDPSQSRSQSASSAGDFVAEKKDA